MHQVSWNEQRGPLPRAEIMTELEEVGPLPLLHPRKVVRKGCRKQWPAFSPEPDWVLNYIDPREDSHRRTVVFLKAVKHVSILVLRTCRVLCV